MSSITSQVAKMAGLVTPSLAGGVCGVARRDPADNGESDGNQVPPTSNTGVLLHPAPSFAPSIDWISFTLPCVTKLNQGQIVQEISNFLGGAVPLDGNRMGYKMVWSVLGSGLICAHPERLEMGVHISLPATALQNFLMQTDDESSVIRIMIEARNRGGKFSRLDICCDTDGITLPEIKDAILSGELVSQASKRYCIESLDANDDGMTIYIGSVSSDRRVRFYDKGAERGDKHIIWTRCEVQLRKEHADKAADYILLSDNELGSLISSAVDFRETGNTRTNNRPQCAWWASWLGHCARLNFTIPKIQQTLDDAWKWLEKSIAPTIAFVISASGDAGLLLDLVKEGLPRIPPHRKSLLLSMNLP